MKRRLPRKKDSLLSDNTTFCLADVGETSPESGTTIPTEEGIKEAKDWVEHNKK